MHSNWTQTPFQEAITVARWVKSVFARKLRAAVRAAPFLFEDSRSASLVAHTETLKFASSSQVVFEFRPTCPWLLWSISSHSLWPLDLLFLSKVGQFELTSCDFLAQASLRLLKGLSFLYSNCFADHHWLFLAWRLCSTMTQSWFTWARCLAWRRWEIAHLSDTFQITLVVLFAFHQVI